MIAFVRHLLGWAADSFRSREDLILENLALRQQLLSFHARTPRPRMNLTEKVFWLALRRVRSRWKQPLILVTPQTVVRWHRTGFRLYWARLSKREHRTGRRPVTRDIRELIRRMVTENPTLHTPGNLGNRGGAENRENDDEQADTTRNSLHNYSPS